MKGTFLTAVLSILVLRPASAQEQLGLGSHAPDFSLPYATKDLVARVPLASRR
ncbi:MAG: hypothetical protein HY563_08775 [Ignavibacteriales bacterium]|nr:hypothetical protein [Ignavibacteriales bacterium]